MLIFYAGKTYRAALTGSADRTVQCEKCQCAYGYQLVRRGEGVASSAYGLNNSGAQQRAQKAAAKKLQKLLATGSDPVACPECGWIQEPMVTDMRRVAHRWMTKLGWVGFALFMCIAFFAWLGMSNGFQKKLDFSEIETIAVFAVIAIAVMEAAHLLRSWWAGRMNPNVDYPHRPGLIPGAPVGYRLDGNGKPVQQPTPVLPETSASGDALLAYESLPAHVEPGGWVTVQLLNFRSPGQCCGCLTPTEQSHTFAHDKLVKVQLPICAACLKRYRLRSAYAMLMGVATGAMLGAIVALAAPRHENEATITFAIVGAIAGVLIGYFMSRKIASPVAFSRFSSERNTIRLRFRNAAFLRSMLDFGRLV